MGRSSAERHHEWAFTGILRGRQVDAEAAAAAFCRQANRVAAVTAGDVAHQGEAKAAAAAGLAAVAARR